MEMIQEMQEIETELLEMLEKRDNGNSCKHINQRCRYSSDVSASGLNVSRHELYVNKI